MDLSSRVGCQQEVLCVKSRRQKLAAPSLSVPEPDTSLSLQLSRPPTSPHMLWYWVWGHRTPAGDVRTRQLMHEHAPGMLSSAVASSFSSFHPTWQFTASTHRDSLSLLFLAPLFCVSLCRDAACRELRQQATDIGIISPTIDNGRFTRSIECGTRVRRWPSNA
jgi:hypothetical protein